MSLHPGRGRRRRLRFPGAGLALVVPLLAGLLAGCAATPPQIVSLDPPNGATGVVADAPIVIAFDQPMDRGSVARRLHISPPLAGCPLPPTGPSRCALRWSRDGTVLTIEHDAPLAPATTYHLHLDPGVRSLSGTENGLDHSWQLTSAPAPVVRSSSPPDGATGVDTDTTLAITFSTPMDPTATAAAITLRPAVPGMRILVNRRDPARFVVVPGALLLADSAYVLSVSTEARDAHGQRLATPVSVHFRTGGLGTGIRAVVLVAPMLPPRQPTTVLLAQPTPAVPGDPPLAVPVASATPCADARCGAVERGQPLTAYEDAALAPDGSRLALVERDLTDPAAPPALHLLDLRSGEDDLLVRGATHPAWSPDGRHLAVVTDGTVHVLTLLDGRIGDDVALPSGPPVVDAPVWSGDGGLLALVVRGPAGGTSVDLAAPAVDARFPVPALGEVLPGATLSRPVFSASGAVLAIRAVAADGSAAIWVVRLRGGPPDPRRLAGDLTPVALVDEGTLLAISAPAHGPARLVRLGLATGDETAVPTPEGLDPSSVAVSADGRLLTFLGIDGNGIVQAWTMHADGTNPMPLTDLAAGHVATAVSTGGGGRSVP